MDGEVEWVCLVDDMRDSLLDLPPRKFYPLLQAVCPRMWRSLGELPEQVCYRMCSLTIECVLVLSNAGSVAVWAHIAACGTL